MPPSLTFSRNGLLENLALRRQLLALHAQRPRTRLTALHKLFWVALRTFWSGWRKPLVLVTPRTVVNWHRAGFRLYWTWISRFRRVGGRKRVSKEVRALIFQTVAENPTWGAPRVHGELLKPSFDLSERSVSRWIRRVSLSRIRKELSQRELCGICAIVICDGFAFGHSHSLVPARDRKRWTKSLYLSADTNECPSIRQRRTTREGWVRTIVAGSTTGRSAVPWRRWPERSAALPSSGFRGLRET